MFHPTIRHLAVLTIVLATAGLALLAADPPATGPAAPGTKGLDDALRNLHAPLSGGDPKPAHESMKTFQVPNDLTVDLIAEEPAVRQPLHISFDERGRMWVVQYRQYPFPAGLKIVEYDRYIRAKFDKVPLPPPNHVRGADLISIHEDRDGDGTFETVKTFVDGLNIATSVLHGRGGVWVLNPPYLLFYPDRDGDDVPDGDPVVHLSGFGLEDTHAVANNLTWGPDGWIYGAQGSTCTAKVKVEIEKQTTTTDFLGQAIWRYHPEKHVFEIFAEGGGNTFGVAFDDQGRLYSGTNWGKYRGLHYVQGGYYIKGWGKHGPLTNPYALGWFEHMPHTGNADRLTHTYVVYGGSTLPERFRGKIIGPSPLQHRVHVTRLEPEGSSYRTAEEPFLLTSSDGWFRPVDLKVGPDGALYVADLYENRISHVDPRDNWDRSNGRIYRVRAKDAKPLAPFDLSKKSGPELVALLKSPDRWFRETALRLLGDRKDHALAPTLRKMMDDESGQTALEALWALNQCGGFDEEAALAALGHANPHVRMWAVRLLGDSGVGSPTLVARLVALAEAEREPQVRSQLASTAKRLSGLPGVDLFAAMLRHPEDRTDVHIPLLLWWALEAHAESNREQVLALFDSTATWTNPLVDEAITERLVQRFAMAGGDANLEACARLLRAAPTPKASDKVLVGLEKAFAGRAAATFPPGLRSTVAAALKADAGGRHLALGVRVGSPDAVVAALKLIGDEKADTNRRADAIRLFGEVPRPEGVPALLAAARESPSNAVRLAALGALTRYDEPRIAQTVLELYDRLTDANGLRPAAQTLLTSRPAWALLLLERIDAGRIEPRSLPLDAVRKLQGFKDDRIAKLVTKHWGKIREATPAQKRAEMERLAAVMKAGTGDATAGKALFTNICGKCHKLFGEGASVGPELTGYERDNLGYWLENVVDPSAVIRDEFMAFNVETTDGRTFLGLIAGQDKATVTLKLLDGQTVRLAREQIEDLRASPQSLMPDDVLKDFKDAQVRDLFAYLMKKK